MKQNLLKFALCAMALLPLGAWADITYPHTWTFTNWSNATITNLNTESAWTSGNKWTVSNDVYSYTAATTNDITLQANSTDISECSGLTFKVANTNAGRLKIYNNNSEKALFLTGSKNNELVYVPSLVGGKKVTIVSKAGKDDSKIECTNTVNVIPFNQTDANQSERTDIFIIASSVTDATTYAFGASAAASTYIYSISVTDATQDELNYANSKVLFGNDEVITATTLWTFDQYVANDNIDNTGSGDNYAGLYLKGHNTSGTSVSKIVAKSATSTYGDISGLTTCMSHWFAGGTGSMTYSELKNRKASLYKGDCNAINIGTAGTIYITAYAANTDRNMQVFRGNSDDTQNLTNESDLSGYKMLDVAFTTANTPQVFSVDITKAGTYWIVGSKAYYINAICFIPADGKEIAMTKTVTLTEAGGGYATFSAPQNYTVPDGVTAYYVSGVDGEKNEAIMESIIAGSVIPACTGVILYKEGVSSDTEITLTSSETYSAVTNDMQPNLAAYALAKNNGDNYNYTLALGPKFILSSGTGTLAAGKAFLRIAKVANARGLTLDFGDETTNISETIVEDISNDDGQWYTLTGQRVNAPDKGIYIKNGKKYMFK